MIMNLPILTLERRAHPAHPPFKAEGGLRREEAIMLLRRFYLTENVNGKLVLSLLVCILEYRMDLAPIPKSKASRALKTTILPLLEVAAYGIVHQSSCVVSSSSLRSK